MDRREALKAGMAVAAVEAPTRVLAEPLAALPSVIISKRLTPEERAEFLALWNKFQRLQAMEPLALKPRRFYSVKTKGEHGRGYLVDATGAKIERCRAGDVITGKCSVRNAGEAGWFVKVFPAPLQWVSTEEQG